MDSRYNHHNRQKYSLKVHIVLVTKYRKQLLIGSIADDVKQKIFPTQEPSAPDQGDHTGDDDYPGKGES